MQSCRLHSASLSCPVANTKQGAGWVFLGVRVEGERSKRSEGCLRRSDYKIEPELDKEIVRKQRVSELDDLIPALVS